MSSSGGILRPALFAAVVALGATGYYAYSQHSKVEAYRTAHASLTAERDALIAKTEDLTTAAESTKRQLQEAEAKVAELESGKTARR